LENIIEHGFVLCHDRFVDLCHLPQHLQPEEEKGNPAQRSRPASALQQGEAGVIRIALGRSEGNRGRAATELGISRTTLWRKMKKYGIDLPG